MNVNVYHITDNIKEIHFLNTQQNVVEVTVQKGRVNVINNNHVWTVPAGNAQTFHNLQSIIKIDSSNAECNVRTTGLIVSVVNDGSDGTIYVDTSDGELPPEEEKPVLKSVFCSYRGILYVHDVHGDKVDELCGEMTLEKYKEIERRSRADITEFDGLEHYRCIVCELEKKEAKKEKQIINGKFSIPDDDKNWDNQHDPFAQPVKGGVGSSPLGTPVSLPNYNPHPTNNYKVPTTQPADPEIGEFYYDTIAGVPKIWDGNKWIECKAGGGVLSSSSGSWLPPPIHPQPQITFSNPIVFTKGNYKVVSVQDQNGCSINVQNVNTGQMTNFSTPFQVDEKWLEELIDKEFDK